VKRYHTYRKSEPTTSILTITSNVVYGKATGNMPDGRRAGEPLSPGANPSYGAENNGLLASLNSVAKLPMKKGVGGTTLNVILTTKMLATTELRRSVSNVIRSFLKNGGCMAQITTANKEDLIDAKCHPERHSDLTVRVGGYSIQFVQMDAISQDEIISRYV
ncbi:MAG: formate acetyltransferase, partial [Clostridia bacterium]|nr:formate acetyltransferase [Clostridia bacterium]